MRRKRQNLTVPCLLLVHAALLAWSASRHSPTWDELMHLPSGLSHWMTGRFDLYRVNPPLVRMVATLPLVFADHGVGPMPIDPRPGTRPETAAATVLLDRVGHRILRYTIIARWACLPFSLMGAYFCFRWAREVYGGCTGEVAMVLWCSSPMILGHGPLCTPDIPASALGVAAGYFFWRWLRNRGWYSAVAAGLILGIAELAKATWIVLFALWPVLWAAWRWCQRRQKQRLNGEGPKRDDAQQPATKVDIGPAREGAQLALILGLGLLLINFGYAFEDSFQRLGDYQFASRTLRGPQQGEDDAPYPAGNRFAGTWLASLPVPVPKNYLLGMDQQKREFEVTPASYLRGEWRDRGWWYYYLYGLAIKVPLGTWALVALAIAAGARAWGCSASLRDDLTLLAPVAVVLTLVSFQTGMNHHLRYSFPVLPFLFVWTSKVARTAALARPALARVVFATLTWAVGSSLWTYPHSLTYFNELVGGPTQGHYHLDNSNVDWGQDLLYLKSWCDKHPEAHPLGVAHYVSLVSPRTFGIDGVRIPQGPVPERAGASIPPEDAGPLPGWYAISVNRIHSRAREYEYFLHFRPLATAGYSMFIYHITLAEANAVRLKLGLPELP